MTNKTEPRHTLTRISHKRIGDIRVLIVVDKYISGKTLKNMLEEWGYSITGICISGQEALVRMKEDKPNLILTDIELSDCNGIHLAQQQQLNLQTDNFNLSIYFTAYTTDLIVQRTINIATALGYSISKCSTKKLHRNFESSICQYYGINQTTNFSKESTIQPIRILLVDNQQIVLWGLEKLINSEKPRMEIIGIAVNISDAKRIATEEKPDIIILNIYLDDSDCVNSIPDLINNRDTRVVIFTEIYDKEAIDRAVLNGARGVVHKKEPMQTILRAIEKIHEGELWLDRITTGRIFLQNSRMQGKASHDTNTKKITTLTRKECIILRAFSDGAGGEQNKQIAAKLCISEHTLRNHLTSIFSKLGIKNRFSLFAYAKQHFQQSSGLLSPTHESLKDPL
jgi:DNA-binding NarL/FixJ family response regulator